MTPSDVNYIMDLPIHGDDANVKTYKKVDKDLFNTYKTRNKIMLNSMEEKITSSVIADDDFKRQFALFAIGVILAPTTKDYVDSKYLGLVKNVQELSNINWGQFTLSHLMDCIHQFKIKKPVNLQGNLPLLQMWFWEHVHAHSRYGVSYAPIPPPLMSRWDEENASRRDVAFKKDELDGGLMDMILQIMNQKHLDLERKIGRGLLDIEHKFDSKILCLNEEMAQIKSEIKTGGLLHTRLLKSEEDLSNLNMEIKEIRSRAWMNTASTAKAAEFKEPSIQDQHLPKPTTPRDESLGRPQEPIGVPSTSQTLQNKTSEEASPKPDRVTRHPIIAMDCSLTQEDKEIAQFLTFSYEDAKIVRIDDIEIIVGMLCRNVTKRFIIDQVLNSLPYIRDEVRETKLVESIQACINNSFENGLVTIADPLNITQWPKNSYTDIPQQQNSYSCGAYVMKYMSAWDGEKMTEPFTQKEEYLAMNPEETELNNTDDSDCIEVIENTNIDKQYEKEGMKKRKRGRPRKLEEPAEPIVQQFSTKSIAKHVQNKTGRGRISKPSRLKKSPYKQL
ncbi:hypothetical protein HU200_049322 [Digitaria exilis]|uniref:Aminotransferase-like plant mobile domain-containing protein n=1 Tax=Digitaria exilis TaxID=1010633 RepID=A0A835AV31_9POAL|nr:hypothetical protein HU200_049322 [Digitaria exilis]